MENAHGLAAVAILESLLDTLVQKEVVARDEARTLMTGSAWLRDAPARPKLTRLWETSSNGSRKGCQTRPDELPTTVIEIAGGLRRSEARSLYAIAEPLWMTVACGAPSRACEASRGASGHESTFGALEAKPIWQQEGNVLHPWCRSHGLGSSRMSASVNPPCRKSKDHDILECVVGSFDESPGRSTA